MTTIPTTPPWPAYAEYVRWLGLTFSPEKRSHEYTGAFADPADGEKFDAVVQAAFILAGRPPYARDAIDPYSVALAVWRADGLLGAADPGPPAFRASHAAYLADRQIDTSDIPEAAAEWWQRAKLGLPRPRLPLQELLDVVAVFQNETRRLVVGSANPSLADLEPRSNAERDRLVAWFAARGVVVDPEA